MSNILAVIHTTPVTVEPLKQLAAELIEGCTVYNVMDDSILPQLAAANGDLNAVAERLYAYAVLAERTGADCILSACSSVGGAVAEMRRRVSIPVVRIDEAMAERAVRTGRRIGVAATLNTTLQPTLGLLGEKAQEAGRGVELRPMLAEGAYKKLMSGDREGHDAELTEALMKLAGETDVVVLAQASMARVAASLPEGLRSRLLSSPRPGMERVREAMAWRRRGMDAR